MKFLCDVHISFKVTNFLISQGFDAVHINKILDKRYTNDNDICKYADDNNFIVITKDSDFKNSFIIRKTPKKLIKINLGNISNTELIEVLLENIESIKKVAGKQYFLIEVDKNASTVISE